MTSVVEIYSPNGIYTEEPACFSENCQREKIVIALAIILMVGILALALHYIISLPTAYQWFTTSVLPSVKALLASHLTLGTTFLCIILPVGGTMILLGHSLKKSLN